MPTKTTASALPHYIKTMLVAILCSIAVLYFAGPFLDIFNTYDRSVVSAHHAGEQSFGLGRRVLRASQSALVRNKLVDAAAAQHFVDNTIASWWFNAHEKLARSNYEPIYERFHVNKSEDPYAAKQSATNEEHIQDIRDAAERQGPVEGLGHLRKCVEAVPAFTQERFEMMGPVWSDACADSYVDMESYGHGDEQKMICGLSKLLSSNPDEQCYVISIGGHNDWDFEDDVVKKTNCIVHTFDCTVTLKVPEHLRERVFGHELCVGGRTEGKFRTYADILKLIGIKRASHLKADIEGSEFPMMMAMLKEARNAGSPEAVRDALLALPEQISMEVHYCPPFRFAEPFAGVHVGKTGGELALFFRTLYDYGGYVLLDARSGAQPICYHCQEVVLARLVEPLVN